jgi:SAP domain-containing new25
MSLTQFEHGYWFATELKQFAGALGIPSPGRLRKDELERAIKQFLQSGTVAQPRTRSLANSVRSQPRDVDLGLPSLRWQHTSR